MAEPTGDFESLVVKAKGGDRSARGELLGSYRGYLMVLTLQYLDRRLAARLDASDVIQQTCITALGSMEQFRGNCQGEFVQWLKVVHEHVMHNMTREHLRTKKRAVSRESPVTDSQMCGLGAGAESGTPSQALMKGELGVRLALALQSLPSDQREAIRQRYFEGCSLEEIARSMDRTKPAVAGLLKRGLDALRKEFEIRLEN